jgi:hypothetical protein
MCIFIECISKEVYYNIKIQEKYFTKEGPFMKYAADFRSIARESLKGKWGLAVITGLVAALLGGLGAEGLDVKLNLDISNNNVSFAVAGQTILSTSGELSDKLSLILAGSAFYIAIAAIVMAALYFVLGSIVAVGYSKFNLDLVDRRESAIETLFHYFNNWKTTAAATIFPTPLFPSPKPKRTEPSPITLNWTTPCGCCITSPGFWNTISVPPVGSYWHRWTMP